MTAGSIISHRTVPSHILWDDYYESLHVAYNALRDTYEASGLSQDDLAERIGVTKSRVSRVLSGRDNLTVKTLSHYGSGMGYRLIIAYVPYEKVGYSNFFSRTLRVFSGTPSVPGTPKIVYAGAGRVETATVQR